MKNLIILFTLLTNLAFSQMEVIVNDSLVSLPTSSAPGVINGGLVRYDQGSKVLYNALGEASNVIWNISEGKFDATHFFKKTDLVGATGVGSTYEVLEGDDYWIGLPVRENEAAAPDLEQDVNL